MIACILIYISNHLYPKMQLPGPNAAAGRERPQTRSAQTSRPTDIRTWSRMPLTKPPEDSLP
jgi:hypothetical protein